MNYQSTANPLLISNFEEAVFKGLPDSSGLYMPMQIPQLPSSFFSQLHELSLSEIGFQVLRPFVGSEINETTFRNIVDKTLSFPIPLRQIHDQVYSLELFHGPTLAFKDVGARFLARILGHFATLSNRSITVLVATSGDTGSAVAHGFYGVQNVDVVVLYPKGKVSDFQRRQMTTLGENIQAIEIDGTFDDCQDLVKQAFLDRNLQDKYNLTSANSINVARFLPQMVYYFWAVAQLKSTYSPSPETPVNVSVPSGNYGNLTAGLLAKRMGLGIDHFIAAANANNSFPNYLTTGSYSPKPSIATLSNAMDVGAPSNVRRIDALYDSDTKRITHDVSSGSFSDQDCLQTIDYVYNKYRYILDPHGAIGYKALSLAPEQGISIFLETAHPIKFKEVVEAVIPDPVIMPTHVEKNLNEEYILSLDKDYSIFKDYLISSR